MQFLCRTQSGTGLQTAVTLRESSFRQDILAQVNFSATGTVIIQGRLKDDDTLFSWEDIVTVSDTDTDWAVRVSPFPVMRVNITASTGTITVGIND